MPMTVRTNDLNSGSGVEYFRETDTYRIDIQKDFQQLITYVEEIDNEHR